MLSDNSKNQAVNAAYLHLRIFICGFHSTGFAPAELHLRIFLADLHLRILFADLHLRIYFCGLVLRILRQKTPRFLWSTLVKNPQKKSANVTPQMYNPQMGVRKWMLAM